MPVRRREAEADDFDVDGVVPCRSIAARFRLRPAAYDLHAAKRNVPTFGNHRDGRAGRTRGQQRVHGVVVGAHRHRRKSAKEQIGVVHTPRNLAVLRVKPEGQREFVEVEFPQQRRRQRYVAPPRRRAADLAHGRPDFEERRDRTDEIAVAKGHAGGHAWLDRAVVLHIQRPPWGDDRAAVRARIVGVDPGIGVLGRAAAAKPGDGDRRIDENPVNRLRHSSPTVLRTTSTADHRRRTAL